MRTRLIFLLASLATMSIALLCFGQSFGEFPELLVFLPANPSFTAAWNPDPGADGFVVLVYYDTKLIKTVDAGTNLQATVPMPGGFDYYVSVQAYSLLPGHKRRYSAPCPAITNLPPLPDNSPQLLVIPPNWFVMCQCSNGGSLQSTILLGSTNWSTIGPLPSNAPALHQGEMAGNLFFRSVAK